MLHHLKKLDWMLIALVLSLVSFGLISLYSIGGDGLSAGDRGFTNFNKQILWLAIGFFLMLIVSFFDYRVLKNNPKPVMFLYIFSLVLLLGVLLFGISVRGAESWYRIGPITLEPVEFVKIAMIILLAKYFSMRHIEMYDFRHVIISGIYVFIPVFLVFLQPDIGSAMILVGLWLGMMIIVGIKIRHLALLAAVGIIVFFISWSFIFADYQKDRLISFVNPEFDPKGAGYNVAQSMIAVGSGGILGKGIGQGSQIQLGFLPEAHTDFIYAAIAEELGLVGVFLLLACFAFLFKQIMSISKNSINNFALLVTSGFSILIFLQVFINIGMTLGLFPITGLPLPFVSYGGSSLVSLFMMLGIIQSIKIN